MNEKWENTKNSIDIMNNCACLNNGEKYDN